MPAMGFCPASDDTMNTWPPPRTRWGSAARQPEDRGQVRVEDLGPVLVAGVGHGRAHADARVVHEDLEPSVRFHRAGHRRHAHAGVANVSGEGERAASLGRDLADEAIEI